MAELQNVPPPAAGNHPGIRVTRARRIRNSSQGFTRMAGVERENDNAPFLTMDALMLLLEDFRDLLERQVRFTIKLVVQARFSKTVAVDGVERPEVQEIRVALPPAPCMPLADPAERFRRFLSQAQSTYEHYVEETNRNTSSGWSFVGMLWINILTSPSELTANAPFPAGIAGVGGCWKELPPHLHKGDQGLFNPKNMDHRCFEYCVRAYFHEVGKMGKHERFTAANLKGRPFYAQPAKPGPKGSAPDERKMVPVDADFSTLPEGHVGFGDIDLFEAVNPHIGIYVFKPVSTEWSATAPQTMKPLRSPSVEKPEHEIVLLLHLDHYVLIYDFSKASSLRSAELPQECRRDNTCHWNSCHRCHNNFKSTESLKAHLKSGLCNASVEDRLRSQRIRLPTNVEEERLFYKPGPSAEWAELVIYSDIEVFNDRAQETLDNNRVKALQHETASTCYTAVGRCGYEVPQQHKIHLDLCRADDAPFAVMERYLRRLLDLAFDYLNWQKLNIPYDLTATQQADFDAAVVCSLCDLPFTSDQSRQKVVHHRRGTGEYLGALCNTCNLAVRRQKTVPVYFHNGGGYDFHFLVRAIAQLHRYGSAAAIPSYDEDDQVVEQEFQEPAEDDATLQDDQVPDLHTPGYEPMLGEHLDLKKPHCEVMIKSGEKYLQIRYGPLVFLDSFNIFPSALDVLIDDLRSTHKEEPWLSFPLLAERHPWLQNRDKRVWDLLLKKIPMPFESFAGPEAWTEEAVRSQKCYDSSLKGKRSDEKYGEIQEIQEHFQFPNFASFHNCYLHTDMAIADVVEAYRDTFHQNFGIDPVRYVTLASAAWDAMMKRCAPRRNPLQLITNRKIYDLVKSSMRGGLSNAFQPYAKANNCSVVDYDDCLPVSWVSKFDVNSQYPTVMDNPLPCDGGYLLDLPSERKARMKLFCHCLRESDFRQKDFDRSYLVEVDYYLPLDQHDRVDWAPITRMSVGTSGMSEYQLELLAKKGLDKAPKNEKLMPYLGYHRREVIQLRLLRFYMEVLGVRVEEVYSIVLFGCRAFMSPFIRECYERRLEFKRQGRKLQADVVKLTMNVQYGKSVQNQERFVRSWVCFDVEEFGRRSAGPRMVDLHASPIGHGGFFGIVDELTPGGSLLKTVPQVGTFVLDEARLGIMRNYYHMKLVFDGRLVKACDEARPQSERSKVQIIYTDTDSVIVLIHSETHPSYQLALENYNPESPCFWDILGDIKDYEKAMAYLQSIGVDPDSAQLAFERRGCLGGFGDENAPLTMMEVVCLGPKSYSELLTDGGGQLHHKNKIKGIDKENRKTLTHDEYREVLTKTGLGRSITSHRFESRRHVVHLVENVKTGLCAFEDKNYKLRYDRSRPHGHWRNLPEPLPYFFDKLLYGKEGQNIIDKIMSFLRPRGYVKMDFKDDRWIAQLRGLSSLG
ncbi:unnamed protein product [Symbiodinium natans]|uniref:DNA-directed DNA polymerase n=1 Tax=Symbiodinium natans TaxID=878477 RepID=A0A812H498_9DINO|nr:unnamed protein product [Symbiodinium natans]